MRYAAYTHQGEPRCGIVQDGTVRHLDAPDLLTAITTGRREVAGPAVPLDEVTLLPPLQPPTVRDFVSFEEHVEGVRRSVGGESGVPGQWYAAPTFYFTNPYAIIGTGAPVPVPPGCRVLDFELEVAVIIGTEGGDLTPEQARDHILGYAIFNDWSARDLQAAEMQVGLGPCKGKDFATTLGPWIVTADELDPYLDAGGFLNLALSVSVNGTEIGRDLLSNMGWPFEDLIAYASRGTCVRPGDVLGSGTCGNGGCLAELWGRDGDQAPPPLQVGDEVTMTVEGIGTITNTITEGAAPRPVPPARKRPRTRPS